MRWPSPPASSVMNTTWVAAKISVDATPLYSKNVIDTNAARPKSIVSAAIRLPTRATDRGPDSGRPTRSPGHSDQAPVGWVFVDGIRQSYEKPEP